MYRLFIIMLIMLLAAGVQAQVVTISGTVLDESHTVAIPNVSVLSNSGRGTMTDSLGRYIITLSEKDSIYFSYLNKPTRKFAVATIDNTNSFDIALHIPITSLKEVKVFPRNYRQDSIENRNDYAKIFNYEKPKLRISSPVNSPFGAGLDLDEIINMFAFQRNKRTQLFQNRLIREEQDKYVDHRFNKATARRITELTGQDLDTFMIVFRPTYYFTVSTSDYDFLDYIKKAGEAYKAGLRRNPIQKPEDFNFDQLKQ